MLDVGTGSGVISASLADIVGDTGEVHSVDVVDVRIETEGYEFHRADGVDLPFPDDSFDCVISNHCVEHTGGRAEQERHVRELGRVLRPDGIGYFAVPNRWGLLEPHFKLPGLSWFPTVAAQSRYVRLARRGERYDCRLLSRRDIRELFAQAGLDARERTLEALHVMSEVEDPSQAFKTIMRAPDACFRPLLVVIPTLVYTFRVPPARA